MDEIKEIKNKIEDITKYPFSKKPCDHYWNEFKMVRLESKCYAACDKCKIYWIHKDYNSVVQISHEYVQMAAESNYESTLTDKELEDFEILFWECEEFKLYEAVCNTIDEIFKYRKDADK